VPWCVGVAESKKNCEATYTNSDTVRRLPSEKAVRADALAMDIAVGKRTLRGIRSKGGQGHERTHLDVDA